MTRKFQGAWSTHNWDVQQHFFMMALMEDLTYAEMGEKFDMSVQQVCGRLGYLRDKYHAHNRLSTVVNAWRVGDLQIGTNPFTLPYTPVIDKQFLQALVNTGSIGVLQERRRARIREGLEDEPWGPAKSALKRVSVSWGLSEAVIPVALVAMRAGIVR